MERDVLIVRAGVIAALVVALALVLVLMTGGGSYTVTANFRDAGQLVKGGNVQVGGRAVGTIDEIRLGNHGLAEVVMKITDDSVAPLRRGTTAQIRALGLSGIANRFVDVKPGPSKGAEIKDGGSLGLNETQGIVDLDAVLSSLDPATRTRLKSLVRSGGDLFTAGAAKDVNRVLKYANPALAQTRLLAEELTHDTHALSKLLKSGAEVTGVLAGRREDLRASMSGVAGTLDAIASEQAALGSLLDRAPAATRSTTASLNRIGLTLDRVQPALRELSKASPALASTLRELPRAAKAARPVLASLRAVLPSLDSALRKLPAVAAVAVPAVRSATATVTSALPIFAGLRPYAPDVVAGLGNGFGGGAAFGYDANGHFARISFHGLGAGTSGLLAGLADNLGVLTPTFGTSARCPGDGALKLQDGSNPLIEQPASCNPEHRRKP